MKCIRFAPLALALVFSFASNPEATVKATLRPAASMQGYPIGFLPDGKTLVVLSGYARNSELRLYDIQTGNLRALPELSQGISSAALSPNGKNIATESDYAVRIWDVQTGKYRVLGKYATGNASAMDIAYSPDGKSIAGRLSDKLCLIDVRTGKARYSPQLEGRIYCFDISPDGKSIAAGTFSPVGNGAIIIWDIQTDQIRELAKGIVRVMSIDY